MTASAKGFGCVPRIERHVFSVLMGAVGLLATSPAWATYSIVATDQVTRQVGGAGTSCVGSLDVSIIYGSVPGVGAVHAQAQVNIAGRDKAVELLGQGSSPSDIVTALTGFLFDSEHPKRQYGVVDLDGRAAGYSGAQTLTYAEDRQGAVGGFTYSVQGNILTSVAVIDQSESAFVGNGCDLADRLMLALEAGAENGEGDSRCTSDGLPSDSAFLHVDDQNGDVLVHLAVMDTKPDSPLPLLRAQYDVWRESHPCVVDVDAGVDAAPDAAPSDGSADGPDETQDADVVDAADAGDPGADSGGAGTGPSEEDGCGCRIAGERTGVSAAWIPGLALLAWGLRRRRR